MIRLASLLLLVSCGSVSPDEVQLPTTLRCGPTYLVPITSAKLNPADCWRVAGVSGAKLSEVDGDCENPVGCLVTSQAAVWLDGHGEVQWEEVACSASCS